MKFFPKCSNLELSSAIDESIPTLSRIDRLRQKTIVVSEYDESKCKERNWKHLSRIGKVIQSPWNEFSHTLDDIAIIYNGYLYIRTHGLKTRMEEKKCS